MAKFVSAVLLVILCVSCSGPSLKPNAEVGLVECTGNSDCIATAKQRLSRSLQSWQKLGKENYQYTAKETHFGAMPDCSNQWTVFVKAGQVDQVNVYDCKRDASRVYSKKNSPVPALTVEEVHQRCESEVLGKKAYAAAATGQVLLQFDAQGVLNSCLGFSPSHGKAFGGELQY